MQFRNDAGNYGTGSRFLHWSIALLMIGLVVVGFYMTGLAKEDPVRRSVYEFHKSIGVLVVELVLLRMLWLSYSRPPVLPRALKRWERTAAKLAHLGLYAMMLGLPITGYVMSTANGYPVGFFGLYELPALIDKSKGIAEFAHEAHEVLVPVTIGLFLAHVAAALKHRFIDKAPDADVLKRML